ncbi:MAG: acyltransferase [Crocinitomicaceae bacterium]
MRNFVFDLNNNSSKYLHSVDFLRGFTALGVVVYHFFNHTDANGALLEEENALKAASSVLPSIVFIFFSLSGFVIAMSMHRNNFQLKSVGGFLARRWVRIEIPYIASIAVYIAISMIWSAKAGDAISVDPMRFLNHLFYTVPFTEFEWYNEVYWTLGLEFQFYIFIALAFPLFVSKDWRVRYGSLIAFSALGLLIPDNRLLFQYAPMFVIGIVAYFHWYSKGGKHPIAWVVMALCLIQVANDFDIAAALFIALSIGIMHVSVSEKNIVTRIGKMGYSLYLIHGAAGGSLLYFLAKNESASWYKYVTILLAILFSLGVSYLFYRCIERPSIKGAKRIHFGTKTDKKHE